MSEDLAGYDNTPSITAEEVGEIEDILRQSRGEGQTSHEQKKASQKEKRRNRNHPSLSSIPAGLVGLISSKVNGKKAGRGKGKGGNRPKVRFSGLEEDTIEEEGGGEGIDNNASEESQSESGGEYGAGETGYGDAEDPFIPGMRSLEMDEGRQKKYQEGLLKQMEEMDGGKKTVTFRNKFLPDSAFGRSEPAYAGMRESKVMTLGPQGMQSRGDDTWGKPVYNEVTQQKDIYGIEGSVGPIKSLKESSKITEGSAVHAGPRVEKMNVSSQEWPGYGPFEDVLARADKFKFNFYIADQALGYQADLISNSEMVMRDGIGCDGCDRTTVGFMMGIHKMALDEKGNKDMLFIILREIKKINENMSALTRQVSSVQTELSTLKETISDLYITLDRSGGDGKDDVIEEGAYSFTKRLGKGKVKLRSMTPGPGEGRDEVYRVAELTLREFPGKPPRIDPNKGYAGAYMPDESEASEAVLLEVIATDVVHPAKKALLQKMVRNAETASKRIMIHKAIMTGRYSK